MLQFFILRFINIECGKSCTWAQRSKTTIQRISNTGSILSRETIYGRVVLLFGEENMIAPGDCIL